MYGTYLGQLIRFYLFLLVTMEAVIPELRSRFYSIDGRRRLFSHLPFKDVCY